MAAYAALVSLINLMEDIKNHPRLSTSFNEKQLEALDEKANFLLNFIDSYNYDVRSKETEDLESRIASEVHAAEDEIESHIVDLILSGSTADEESSSKPSLNSHKKMEDVKFRLHNLIEAMNSIETSIAIAEIEPEREFRDKSPENSSTGSVTSSSTTTVGFDDESIQILERLTQPEADRKVLPIVGMGGTGKTTLAKLVYEHSLIAHHFDVRMWASISQQYRVENILAQLLFGEKSPTTQTVNELGENLHKKLWGRRYLIILDDMWSLETWNEIQIFLPNNGNGDRIVITTRLSSMASHLSSCAFEMNFLDEEKSWRLFCAKAFGEEDCPHELEGIGRDIVRKCKGLALSIVVIGGHLRKSSRMKGYWESVGDDITSILDSGEDQCLNILSLSYNHLPAHLKPCFLYMGVFEEDREIYAPRLTNLWIAEGFLKPNKDKSKEEIAGDYLKDLVDRNLVLVHRWDRDGKYKFCKIHDLLRDLSIKVAMKENFFCILDTAQIIDREHRVVIHKKQDAGTICAQRSEPLVRSLKCEGGELSSNFRLLRVVIDKVEVVLHGGLLDPDFQQVNLRYLDCHFVKPTNATEGNQMPTLYLPPSLSLIWNLQTLEISGAYDKIVAPSEIWKMTQLRRLDVRRFLLPDPPHGNSNGVDHPILQNLLTLGQVENFSLSEDVCKRIPNIKQLDLVYDFHREQTSDEAISYYCPQNLGFFHKLESLSCSSSGKPSSHPFARCLTFPASLRSLRLTNVPLRWDDMTVISSLAHLVDLELFNSAFGSEWNPVEMGFPCLKFLMIYGCRHLVCWNAESSHFPVLERLYLLRAHKLDEIPSGVGDIPTLKSIALYDCSNSATISAARIMVEQQELGNDGLSLEVTFNNEEKLASLSKMLQQEGLSCNNLRLKLSTQG